MGYPSFADVKRAFAGENGMQGFNCIGSKRNTACTNPLVDQRKVNAKVLLQKDIVDLEETERLNVVVFLLCAACQTTNTQRTNIKAKWQPENLGLELWRNGLRSPFSLRPSRSAKTTHGSRTQKKRRGVVELRSSTPSRSRWHDEEPPSSPCEDYQRRHHRTAFLGVPQVVDVPEDESQQDLPESESVTTVAQTPNQGSAGTRRSQRKVFGEPLHRISDTQSFHRGKYGKYSPSTLRLRVLQKLFEPVSDDTGFVYAVPVAGTQYVKIGKTTASAEKRIEAISKDCRVALDLDKARWSSRIPGWQMDRLEDVVHEAFAGQQLDLLDEKSKPKVHREFFEVDRYFAEKSIYRWLWRMRSIGLKPGRPVDQTTQQMIQDSLFGADESPVHIDSQGQQESNEASSNQEREERIWDTAFKYRQGGFQRLSQLEEIGRWLGIVASILIAFLLPVTEKVSICVALGLAKAWYIWMDGAEHLQSYRFWKRCGI